MKRSPLQRTTPLARRTPLGSGIIARPSVEEPKPDTVTRQRPGGRPRAERRPGQRPSGNPIPRPVRAAVMERDEDTCQRCGRNVRSVGAWSIQHRKPRGAGGTPGPQAHRLSLLVLMCGTATTGCHGWAESQRTDATRLGWLISKFEPADPQTIPLRGQLHRPNVAVYLDDDGLRTTVLEEIAR